jgi:hypothetical protein
MEKRETPPYQESAVNRQPPHPNRNHMKQDLRVLIENPCPAKWNQMPSQADGRFCSICSKVVIDFSGKTLDEISAYLDKKSGHSICGNYQERHTTTHRKGYRFLNAVESFFSGTKFQRSSLFFISILLVLSGCRSRHVTGAYSTAVRKDKRKPVPTLEGYTKTSSLEYRSKG